MRAAILLCPLVAGCAGFGQGVYPAAGGGTVCPKTGTTAGAGHETARAGTKVNRVQTAGWPNQGANCCEHRVSRAASGYSKNSEYFPPERPSALSLDSPPEHSGGKQSRRTGTQTAGHCQKD